MLEEGLPAKRQRVQSAQAVAYRSEHRLMLPFRKRIGQLQTRTAFTLARANSGKTAAHGEVEQEFAAIRSAVTALLAEVEAVVPGSGAGPAENCQRALLVLLHRLEITAP